MDDHSFLIEMEQFRQILCLLTDGQLVIPVNHLVYVMVRQIFFAVFIQQHFLKLLVLHFYYIRYLQRTDLLLF